MKGWREPMQKKQEKWMLLGWNSAKKDADLEKNITPSCWNQKDEHYTVRRYEKAREIIHWHYELVVHGFGDVLPPGRPSTPGKVEKGDMVIEVKWFLG